MSEKKQKELYCSAFSHLHASGTLEREDFSMNSKSREYKGRGFRCRRSLAVLAAVLTVLMAISVIAYAATDGEVLQTVKVWINGEPEDASAYIQEDGTIKIDLSGGGSVEAKGDGWSVEAQGEGFTGDVKIDGGETEVTIDEIQID